MGMDTKRVGVGFRVCYSSIVVKLACSRWWKDTVFLVLVFRSLQEQQGGKQQHNHRNRKRSCGWPNRLLSRSTNGREAPAGMRNRSLTPAITHSSAGRVLARLSCDRIFAVFRTTHGWGSVHFALCSLGRFLSSVQFACNGSFSTTTFVAW
jgi:hypothetical protein